MRRALTGLVVVIAAGGAFAGVLGGGMLGGGAGGFSSGAADLRYVNDDSFDGVTIDDATTNAVTQALHVTHTSTGTPANGIGVGMSYIVETAAGNNEVGGSIDVVATDVTGASEDFAFYLELMTAGATKAAVLIIDAATAAFATAISYAGDLISLRAAGTTAHVLDDVQASGTANILDAKRNGGSVMFSIQNDGEVDFAGTAIRGGGSGIANFLASSTAVNGALLGTAGALNGAAPGTSLQLNQNAGVVGASLVTSNVARTAAAQVAFDLNNGSLAATSGTQYGIKTDLAVAQSGTAGYTAFDVDVTETSLGSGEKNLMSLRVGGTAKLTVDQNGLVRYPTAAGLTALAGGGQGGAGALTAMINQITVVATAGDSVTLPTAIAGLRIVVINDDASEAMDVFPASGDDLGAGADTAASLAAGAQIEYGALDATTWVSL